MPRRRPRDGRDRRRLPLLEYQSDPIREAVRQLGRKWTLLLLRDMAFLRLRRFGELLRNNPGLTPRVLSRRLRQMQTEGLVVRSERGSAVSYRLTRRGEDAVYILLAILRFGLGVRAPGASPPAEGTGVARPRRGAVGPPRKVD